MNPKYKNKNAIASSSDRQNNRAERHKYLFELMKHMTTLSSASVGFAVTFLGQILHGKSPNFYILLTLILFGVSIIFSLGTMLILASNFGGKFAEEDKNYFSIAAMIAIMGFFTGMSFLMIAAYRSY